MFGQSPSAVLAFLDPRREFVCHTVVTERQDEQVFADDTSNNEMPRRAHPAPLFRDPSTAVAEVVMQTASDMTNAGTGRIVKQILERLKHQAFVALARLPAEAFLALFEDVVELLLRWPSE